MIKIHNNTPTREDIPSFLQGLKQESLYDLSWTDPNLGVSDCRWYPEVDESLPLTYNQKYDGEVLTVDEENKLVKVVKNIVSLTEEELELKRTQLENSAQIRIEIETAYANKNIERNVNKAEVFEQYKIDLSLVPSQTNYPFEITWPSQPTL
jgi:hypothetical protein